MDFGTRYRRIHPVNDDLQVAPTRVSAEQLPASEVIDISIIVPVYNECDSLRAFHHMLSMALESILQSVEIIFCDDGSRDGSAALLDELAASDPRICVVHLRRNYGQTAAIMAGNPS